MVAYILILVLNRNDLTQLPLVFQDWHMGFSEFCCFCQDGATDLLGDLWRHGKSQFTWAGPWRSLLRQCRGSADRRAMLGVTTVLDTAHPDKFLLARCWIMGCLLYFLRLAETNKKLVCEYEYIYIYILYIYIFINNFIIIIYKLILGHGPCKKTRPIWIFVSSELASWWLPCSTLWDWRLLVALGLAKMSQGWHGVIPPFWVMSVYYTVYIQDTSRH